MSGAKLAAFVIAQVAVCGVFASAGESWSPLITALSSVAFAFMGYVTGRERA